MTTIFLNPCKLKYKFALPKKGNGNIHRSIKETETTLKTPKKNNSRINHILQINKQIQIYKNGGSATIAATD